MIEIELTGRSIYQHKCYQFSVGRLQRSGNLLKEATHVALSDAQPMFCVERKTRKEAERAGRDVINSYMERFDD